MTLTTLARPGLDESAPFYHRYIATVDGDSIGDALERQPGELRALIEPLGDDGAGARYAPGKWSVKEVLGHLIDAERIFAYRLLRLGRGDPTPLPGFDENPYVAAARFDRRPAGALLDDLDVTRTATTRLADSLPEGAWSFRGEASGHAVTARALLYIIIGHLSHHQGVLRDRYGLGR